MGNTSLVVQQLRLHAPSAEGSGGLLQSLVREQDPTYCKSSQAPMTEKIENPSAATKTQCNQINK